MRTSPVQVVRFRHHPGTAVAGLVVAISMVTLAGVSGWLLLFGLLPLVWSAWVWRAGTDVDRAGVRVRALLGTRWIPWSRVQGLVAESRKRVAATLTDGTAVTLTAVTAADLPKVTAAAGQEPPGPTAEPSPN